MILRPATPSDASAILALNDEAVAVTSPMDAEKIQHLFDLSALSLVAKEHDQILGFLIGITDHAPYQNGNYQWFSGRLKNFFYIDRVVISPQAQGKGLGQKFYSHIQEWALKNQLIQLAAEMDLHPPNTGSLNFHQKNGFTPIGQRTLENGKTVSMQTKPL
ncbi:MAG: GNAT family N-acetyltransferase [Verrucomicrobiaceae bacterium]